MQLSFNVDKNVLSRTDEENLVANSKNYVTAKFNFSDDWHGKTKTVRFSRDERSCSVLLDEGDSCLVPNEVMAEAGSFRVAVLGVGDNVAIPTTNAVVAHVYAGFDSKEEAEKVESLNVLEQVLNRLAACEQGIVKSEIVSQCIDNYLAEHQIGTQIDTEELGSVIVQKIAEYFTEHKAEFKGDPGEPGKDGIGKNGNDGRDAKPNMVMQNHIITDEPFYTIKPNQLYVFDEVPSEFEITFDEPEDDSIVNDYHFVITSPITGLHLVLPNEVNRGDFSVEAGYVYEVSIVNNLLIYNKWSL